MAQEALARITPVLRDFIMEHVKGVHLLLRIVHFALNEPHPPLALRIRGVLFVVAGPHLRKLPFIDPDVDGTSANAGLNRSEKFLERLAAQEEDLVTTLVRTGVVLVRDLVGWEDDVASRDEEHLVAIAAFRDVEASGALCEGRARGSNLQTERRGERATNVDGGVGVIAGFEEPWANRPGVDRLPELNVNVGNVKLFENIEAAERRSVGVFARERLGSYPDPKYNGARSLFELGEANAVNTRPFDL